MNKSIKEHQERAEKRARPSLSAEINSMLDEAFNEGVDQCIEKTEMAKRLFLTPSMSKAESMMFSSLFNSLIADFQQLKKQQ